MAPRPQSELQTLLLTLCDNVYFQPPESLKLEYPCIVYHRDNAKTKFAGNKPYSTMLRYSVVVIDRNPIGALMLKMLTLPLCLYDRYYTADNLNHDAFKLFF